MTDRKHKITPHLWFDTEAVEAAGFYTSIFDDSRVTSRRVLENTPSGSAEMVSFELLGQPFQAISAGPLFSFNPSISFQVHCATEEEVDGLWEALSDGGMVLMELGEYPFSRKFGWVQDKYGLSWQIMLVDEGAGRQRIVPMLMFVGEQAGHAEEAIRLYTSVFENSEVDHVERYGPGEEPDPEGTVKQAAFRLAGQAFAAMDSAHQHDFGFNEAISLMVTCDTQEEIDTYWERLSAVPEAEQCGWLKDRFGVSWQVVPSMMGEMLQGGTEEQVARVTEAFLQMKKFDLAALERAYAG